LIFVLILILILISTREGLGHEVGVGSVGCILLGETRRTETLRGECCAGLRDFWMIRVILANPVGLTCRFQRRDGRTGWTMRANTGSQTSHL